MKLLFATQNQHKVQEFEHKWKSIGGNMEILSLNDFDLDEEIPETQPTIPGNALQKARFVHDRYGINCFADDTGLEIEALNGEPGVRSARYAGEQKDFNANIDKVLEKMKDEKNRKARFVTSIALIFRGNVHFFEGEVCGQILTERHGNGGFGYDSIFLPDGYNQTFAELSLDEKNKISHRGRAIEKLQAWLGKNV